jgi:hypothetical protein
MVQWQSQMKKIRPVKLLFIIAPRAVEEMDVGTLPVLVFSR